MTLPLLRLAAGISGRIIGTAASIVLESLWPVEVFNQHADALWDSAGDRARVAAELGAQTALLQDIRNALTASAAPVTSPTDAAAEERPAPEPPPATGAGQLFPFINHDKDF